MQHVLDECVHILSDAMQMWCDGYIVELRLEVLLYKDDLVVDISFMVTTDSIYNACTSEHSKRSLRKPFLAQRLAYPLCLRDSMLRDIAGVRHLRFDAST